MCTQQNKNEDYKECESEYVKSYEFADDQFKRALARRAPRNITYHAPVAQCHYCVKNPTAPECAEAVAAFEEFERSGARAAQAAFAGAKTHAVHQVRPKP